MSSAYWAFDWAAKLREMDLAEVILIEETARQIHNEKLNDALKRKGPG
jgi:hypothetical protein